MTEAIKKLIKMSIWVAIIIFVVRCRIGWKEIIATVDNEKISDVVYLLFGYAGEAISITTIFILCFNKWWWRFKPLNIIAGGMPVLAKEYKGKIRFKNEREQEEERKSKITINQTFLKVVVKYDTNESSSNSIVANIIKENDTKKLIYTYNNIPRAELQDRSGIHYGTVMLDIDNPKHLTGNYFTTRRTAGSMDFLEVKEKKEKDKNISKKKDSKKSNTK